MLAHRGSRTSGARRNFVERGDAPVVAVHQHQALPPMAGGDHFVGDLGLPLLCAGGGVERDHVAFRAADHHDAVAGAGPPDSGGFDITSRPWRRSAGRMREPALDRGGHRRDRRPPPARARRAFAAAGLRRPQLGHGGAGRDSTSSPVWSKPPPDLSCRRTSLDRGTAGQQRERRHGRGQRTGCANRRACGLQGPSGTCLCLGGRRRTFGEFEDSEYRRIGEPTVVRPAPCRSRPRLVDAGPMRASAYPRAPRPAGSSASARMRALPVGLGWRRAAGAPGVRAPRWQVRVIRLWRRRLAMMASSRLPTIASAFGQVGRARWRTAPPASGRSRRSPCPPASGPAPSTGPAGRC